LEPRPALARGSPVPEGMPLSELDLHWGDVLQLGSEAHAGAPARATLAIVGGLEAGRTIRLDPGANRVGRDAGIAIDDPSLSGTHVLIAIAADGSATVADAGSRNGTTLDGEPLRPGE